MFGALSVCQAAQRHEVTFPRLTAGGFLDWVECSVDEGNKAEFAKLQKDQMVTFIGLGEQFWIGGPRFKHCRVAAQ